MIGNFFIFQSKNEWISKLFWLKIILLFVKLHRKNCPITFEPSTPIILLAMNKRAEEHEQMRNVIRCLAFFKACGMKLLSDVYIQPEVTLINFLLLKAKKFGLTPFSLSFGMSWSVQVWVENWCILRILLKIQLFLSNSPASDSSFSMKTANFHVKVLK